ncbi:MAG: CHAD domain-containing protein [Tractidigestivibacter sp.]|jgi:phosphohistidine phosphatase SixA/CHAD domain-containing protein|uniref:CHAD domain-containing protein n=1 Tax=Tractidigestivibacter sp. TaxID=2847320 RepID=UPI003D916F1E
MVKTLVLVRHGRAEKAAEGVSDKDRQLTNGATHALRTAYPRTFSLMDEEDDVHVWCSSAIRAMQTAQYVADALGASDIEVSEALYEQDVDVILGQIAASKEKTVVIVGHVPSLNAIASRLLGADISLETGSAIALRMPDCEGAHAKLLWYVAGPQDALFESLVSIEDAVASCADELSAKAEAFLEDPTDVDALRDFRIAVRRQRSISSFLRPWISKKQEERVDKALRDVQDASLRMRCIDILSGCVDDLVETGELGDNSLLPVACAKERQLECESFLAYVRKHKVRRKLGDALRDLHAIHWKKSVQASGLTERDLQARFDQELEAVDNRLFGIDLSDADAVHSARVDAKEVHYVANRLGVVLGDERAQMSQYMDEIQKDLGELDNARVNASLAHEFQHSPRFRGVRADLGVVARDQEEVSSAIVTGIRRREPDARDAVEEDQQVLEEEDREAVVAERAEPVNLVEKDIVEDEAGEAEEAVGADAGGAEADDAANDPDGSQEE